MRFFLIACFFVSTSASAADVFDFIRRSNLKSLQAALEKSPEAYQASNSKKETILTFAARSGEVEIIKFLIKKIDINQRDGAGHTALYSAVNNSQEKAALYLIQSKADTGIVYDGVKENILHVACRAGTLKVIDELLGKAPQLMHQTNNFGETPLFETVRGSQSKAARALLAAGAKKDVQNKKMQTVLDLIDPKADKKLYRIFRNREEP